jgi:hypothetical protein
MRARSFKIALSELTDRDREAAAAELARAIKASDQAATVDREQDNPSAMDFGATLIVVLSSGAAVAVARGIQGWMGRWKNARITISDEHRKVTIEGIDGAEAVRALELFMKPQQ